MTRKTRLRLLLAFLAAPLLTTTAAGLAPPDAAMFEELRRQDLRIATISHRLLTANAALCRETEPRSGLVIHHAAQYDPDVRTAAVRHFNLGYGAGIEAVVPGSAAAMAGFLPDDRLLTIDSAPLPSVPTRDDSRADPAGMTHAVTALQAALARGTASVEVERAGRRLTLSLAAETGCASDVELMTSGEYNSWTDGRTVGITAAMAAFAADDAELAALIAHELAHNVREHPAMLRALGVPKKGMLRGFGKNGARVRATEADADYVSIYLLANAGYDVAAAPRFWRRFGKAHGVPGIFAGGTHPGTRERVRLLNATIAELRAKQGRGDPLRPNAAPPEVKG